MAAGGARIENTRVKGVGGIKNIIKVDVTSKKDTSDVTMHC